MASGKDEVINPQERDEGKEKAKVALRALIRTLVADLKLEEPQEGAAFLEVTEQGWPAVMWQQPDGTRWLLCLRRLT